MATGASIKFKSYEESIPALLKLLRLGSELKKYDKIVLKPFFRDSGNSTPVEFAEEVLKFCLENKNPVAEIFIAEGAEEQDTFELFNSLGYKNLAEKYSVGLVDLNNAETEEIQESSFLKFSEIHYPKILLDSFVISLPKLSYDDELEISDSLSAMINAFPESHYRGFFSKMKNKIRKWHIKYSINDIIACKMPNFAIIDASEYELILAGLPLEIDKQAARVLEVDWRTVPHLRTIDRVFYEKENEEKPKQGEIEESVIFQDEVF